MDKIGITGGIGSGKTTVCKVFELLGVAVFNADIRAKALMTGDPSVRQPLIQLLGPDIFVAGNLDRKKMAERIFPNQTLLEKVNSIVHPLVMRDFNIWCEQQKGPYVLHEAAILFESGFYQSMLKNILVSAPVDVRIKRVMQRDGLRRDEVERRITYQWTEKNTIALADFVIINDAHLMILPQILQIHKNLTNQA